MKKKLIYILSLKNNNYIFLKSDLYNFQFFIFSFFSDLFFFIKKINIYNVFLFKKNIFVLAQNKNIITSIKKIITKYVMESLKGNMVTLIIKGRNYKFFYEKGYLVIFLGFCHYIYIKLPKNILIFSIMSKNTKLLLYSLKKTELLDFSYFLKKLYKKDIYKGKGIHFSADIINLKEGKKKEFF